MPIQVIRSARANYPIEGYIADKGQLFYDEDTGVLRRSDGITPGGIALSTGADDVQAYLDSVQRNIVPDQDSLRDLGSPKKQWRDLYLSGNSLFLNGVRISVEDNILILPLNTRIQDQQVSNFSGDYTDLINKPTIPTNTNQLTNDAEFITASALSGLATETYVDQAISDVVGAAPEVLDTLKELSDALGNDADFAANITATISAKANSADFNPVAFSGDYTDLTNTPTIPSDVSDLSDTNSLLFSGDYTDLTNKPDLSVYQLLANAFNGNYSDLSNKPVVPTDISDLTDEQGRLATAYSFSIAADDSTQRLISNNETVKISGANGVTTSSDNEGNITVSGPNLSTVSSSGDYDDLSNKPAIPGDIGDLTDTNNLLFSGDYQDLSNTPTIPQNLNDLSDVDVATNTPQFGQVLKYDGEKWGPAADQGSIDPATGGVVTDASTLNGFAGTYYLNYNNLNNKPAPYELPSATAETLGGVRVGENITVTNGTISVPKGAGINKVVDIPDVYDDNGLENKYILRYNSGATRWETEDLDLSNSTMDGGFY